MNNIKLVSLNVRGLQNKLKRTTLFNYFKREKFDIICMQEAHVTARDVPAWERQWGGKFFVNEGTNRKRGEVILVSKHFIGDVQLELVQERVVMVSLSINNLKLNVVNCYLPNSTAEKIAFFRAITDKLSEVKIQNLIIVGDFNCVLNSDLDIISGQPHHQNEIKEFNNFVKNLEIVDIWRQLHDKEKDYTWNRAHPFIARRLDYCFVDESLTDLYLECKHQVAPCTDHKAVVLDLNRSEFKRGPSYWKFNNSYLKDKEFVDKMNNLLREKLSEDPESSSSQKWELCKVAIRSFSTNYGKELATKRKNEECKLLHQIQNTEKQLVSDPDNNDLQSKVFNLKQKLDLQMIQKTKGAQIRSRIKWVEEGERNSKYFFNLEKSRKNRNIITKLTNDSGETLTDQRQILKEQVRYYKELYSQTTEADNIVEEVNEFLQNVNFPTLEAGDAQSCEENITLEETTSALRMMKNDTAPGSDGITTEFLKFFWNIIGKTLTSSFEESFQKGELSYTQKLGIITLIHKGKELDRDRLSNWRPITLTNSDYKILAKTLAERLGKVITTIVNEDQVGYIKGRNISTVIRTIDDAINYLNKTKKAGYLLAIDYSKAFDSISKTFMLDAFSRFGFGPKFLRWVSVLNKGCISSINHGGWISEPFDLLCGIKQGCPFSPLAFVLSVELLAIKIRNSSITGIVTPHTEEENQNNLKIKQYADDTTFFLRNKEDMTRSIEILNSFQRFSGLKMNRQKTKALRIGTQGQENGVPFQTVEKIKILGIYFENGKLARDIKENWCNRVAEVNRIIKDWSRRDLSIQGKIIVAKTFLISKLVYVMQSISLPQEILKKINLILYKFLWQKKYSNRKAFEKVKRKVMESKPENGGLNMINLIEFQNLFYLQWAGKLFHAKQHENWSYIPKWHFDKLAKGNKIFSVNCKPGQSKNLDSIDNEFWTETIKAYLNNKKISDTTKVNSRNFQQQLLFNNALITYKKQVLFFDYWQKKGIEQVKDVINYADKRLLSMQEIQNLIGHNRARIVIDYNILINSIPKDWLRWIHLGEHETIIESCEASMFFTKPKIIKQLISLNKEIPVPISQSLWERKFGIKIGKTDWNRAIVSTKETRLRVLHWKILHNIYPTNILLKKMKKEETDKCSYCPGVIDQIEHFFCTCRAVDSFWRLIESKIRTDFDVGIRLTVTNILFGVPYSSDLKGNYLVINKLLLIGKMCISIYKKTKSITPLIIIFERENQLRSTSQ